MLDVQGFEVLWRIRLSSLATKDSCRGHQLVNGDATTSFLQWSSRLTGNKQILICGLRKNRPDFHCIVSSLGCWLSHQTLSFVRTFRALPLLHFADLSASTKLCQTVLWWLLFLRCSSVNLLCLGESGEPMMMNTNTMYTHMNLLTLYIVHIQMHHDAKKCCTSFWARLRLPENSFR